MNLVKRLIIGAQLILSAGLAIYGVFITAYFALAPWDARIFKPDVGTFPRTLNDMVESPIGQLVLLLLVITMIAVPMVKTLKTHSRLALRVIIANLLAVFVGALVMLGAYNLNNVIFPIPDADLFGQIGGYWRSIIPLTTLLLIYGTWRWELNKIAKVNITEEKAKVKNSDVDTARHRLSDDNLASQHHDSQETVASQSNLRS